MPPVYKAAPAPAALISKVAPWRSVVTLPAVEIAPRVAVAPESCTAPWLIVVLPV